MGLPGAMTLCWGVREKVERKLMASGSIARELSTRHRRAVRGRGDCP